MLAIDGELPFTKFWKSSALGLVRGLLIPFKNKVPFESIVELLLVPLLTSFDGT